MARFPLKPQGGFTLIEVLISVLILSIGLLGIAGLQAAALQSNQSAFSRSQATALAYDLADRMRSNIVAVNNGSYAAASAASTSECLSTAGCDAATMALHDLAEWQAAIDTYLPMGDGWVCIDSTPADGTGASVANAGCDGAGGHWVVKIWWDDNKDGVITTDDPTRMERLEISFQP